jgi:hypothetical protein
MINEKAITHVEMKEVERIYVEAFHHTFDNFANQLQVDLAIFWVNIVAAEKPYLMIREDGVVRMRDMIFSNKTYTDFVLQFTYVFFSRWSATTEERNRFIEIIANSISSHLGSTIANPLNEYNGMPPEVIGRLASQNDAIQLLTVNGWLLVLVLAPVFMSYGNLTATIDKKPRKDK